MQTLNIHPELQGLIPPLSEDERKQLIENLRAYGCQDAIVIWEEQNVILDGHNRYDICQTYELPFNVTTISLPDLDAAQTWMLKHQLGRRNLTPEQMSYLRGKQRQLVGHKNHRPDTKVAQNELLKTDEQLADEHKVGVATIKRDAAYVKDVDTIAQVSPDAKQAILARDTKVAREDVKVLAEIAKDSPQAAKNVLAAAQAAPTPKAAKQVIRDAAKALPKQQPEEPQAKSIPLTLVHETPEQPEEWIEEVRSSDGRTMYIVHSHARSVFNSTNEMVDWASWT
jgi:hypothetical protein